MYPLIKKKNDKTLLFYNKKVYERENRDSFKGPLNTPFEGDIFLGEMDELWAYMAIAENHNYCIDYEWLNTQVFFFENIYKFEEYCIKSLKIWRKNKEIYVSYDKKDAILATIITDAFYWQSGLKNREIYDYWIGNESTPPLRNYIGFSQILNDNTNLATLLSLESKKELPFLISPYPNFFNA